MAGADRRALTRVDVLVLGREDGSLSTAGPLLDFLAAMDGLVGSIFRVGWGPLLPCSDSSAMWMDSAVWIDLWSADVV